jgi:hypothetical protein
VIEPEVVTLEVRGLAAPHLGKVIIPSRLDLRQHRQREGVPMPRADIRDRLQRAIEALEHELHQIDAEAADIQAKREQAEAGLQKTREVLEMMSSLPPNVLSLLDDDGTQEKVSDEQAKTHYQRIAGFFSLTNNAPATIAAIEEETGISRSSISAVLYRTHTNDFASFVGPGRAKMWRLRTEDEKRGNGGFEEDIPF